MTEQTPEEARREAEAAADMVLDIETYRERQARHSDFQPVIYRADESGNYRPIDLDDK